MTNSIKGFVEIAATANSAPGIVSGFGELSQYAHTYSRDVREFSHNSYLGYRLKTFKSRQSNNSVYTPPTDLVAQILKMVNACVIHSPSLIAPYNKANYLTHLNNQFSPSPPEITALDVGPFVSTSTPGILYMLPSWISWTDIATDTQIKIWLANQNFVDEYDEFEIVVVSPFEPASAHHSGYANVQTLLNSLSYPDFNARVQTARGLFPETQLRFVELTYTNIANTAQTLQVPFQLLIYGKAGDSLDAYNQAILEWGVANSVYNDLQWIAIYPGLNELNQFWLIPMWHKVALPNLGPNSVIYSAYTDQVTDRTFVAAMVSAFTSTHLNSHLHFMPFDYKCINAAVVDGVTNVAGKQNITELFADYIPVPTSSADFIRMEPATREFSLIMQEMLIYAETMTLASSVPSGYRRVSHYGHTWLSKTFGGVTYLVALKSNGVFD